MDYFNLNSSVINYDVLTYGLILDVQMHLNFNVQFFNLIIVFVVDDM